MAAASEVLAITDEVARVSRRTWEISGEAASTLDREESHRVFAVSDPDAVRAVVVVPRRRHLECVFDRSSKFELAIDFLSDRIVEGWGISALVPLDLLGDAHDVWHGMPIMVQGWWRDPAGDLKFASPEAP